VAEDSDLEKTEAPSQRRLDKAREEGQVVQSRELSTFAVLMAGGGALWAMAGSMGTGFAQLLRSGLQFDTALADDPSRLLTRLAQQTGDALLILAPVLGLLALAALAAPMLLHGWLFTGKAVAPKFSRIDPLSGIKRMLSAHGLVEMSKALAKVVLLGGVAVWLLWHDQEAIVGLASQSAPNAIAHMGDLLGRGFLFISGAMIFIVIADVPFQLWNHHRKLKMTREELRQEARESDGDPQLKARVRQMQREVARRRMMAEIPHADVVVTNPTHYAVALKYRDGEMRAPRVVAKGADLVAAKIRALALENGVPLLEAPPLARALYAHTDLGDEIPAALYAAVAEVLAYVFQLRRAREVGGRVPDMPVDLPVPPELDPQAAS
jgi:flagellar biosynthetic protein FlhB